MPYNIYKNYIKTRKTSFRHDIEFQFADVNGVIIKNPPGQQINDYLKMINVTDNNEFQFEDENY
jgi:hypothetical protein